jgi:hypothetical protein
VKRIANASPTPNDLAEWTVLDLHADSVSLKITEAIRCNATGETRERESSIRWFNGDDGPHTYNWEDGNFSCDCNRAMFFAAAAGEPDPDVPCSNGLFSVRLSNAKTGEVFYDEFED